eukprot:5245207-Pyramimonas_sp.AAC.1
MLTTPASVSPLRARSDMQEVALLLEGRLWPDQSGLCRPTPSDAAGRRGQHDGVVPPGDTYLDGSAFEVEFDGYASVGWSLAALKPDCDEYLMSVA